MLVGVGRGKLILMFGKGQSTPKLPQNGHFVFLNLTLASSLVVKHNIQGLSLSGFIAGVGAERPDSVGYQFPN